MSLKEELLRLLKTDEEFRYAVAGLLGYEELLRRVDRQEKQIRALRREVLQGFKRVNEALARLSEAVARHDEMLAKHGEEIAQLRKEMLEGFKRHDEMLAKHDEEVAKLRREMLEGFKRHDEEIAQLRKEMIEGFKRHDELLARHSEEIAQLRKEMLEGFKRHDEEIAKLRSEMLEGFKRHDEMLAKHSEEIAQLRKEMIEGFRRHGEILAQHGERITRLERAVENLRSAMLVGFNELRKFAGLTFEEFVRKLLTAEMKEAGRIPPSAELRAAVIEGEQIDIFLEDPLIVGEVTSYADTAEEVDKLLRKAEAAKKKYGREPQKLLIILAAPRNVARELKRKADENGVELIIGKHAEE